MVVSERSKNACIFISEETLHRQILRQQKMGSSRFRQEVKSSCQSHSNFTFLQER